MRIMVIAEFGENALLVRGLDGFEFPVIETGANTPEEAGRRFIEGLIGLPVAAGPLPIMVEDPYGEDEDSDSNTDEDVMPAQDQTHWDYNPEAEARGENPFTPRDGTFAEADRAELVHVTTDSGIPVYGYRHGAGVEDLNILAYVGPEITNSHITCVGLFEACGYEEVEAHDECGFDDELVPDGIFELF